MYHAGRLDSGSLGPWGDGCVCVAVADEQDCHLRAARPEDMAAVLSLGGDPARIGVRWFVAESRGMVVAILAEHDDLQGYRWVTDWYGEQSRSGRVGLSRLERDFERRAKADGCKGVRGMSEPSDTPNLLLFLKRGWTMLGVVGGKEF